MESSGRERSDPLLQYTDNVALLRRKMALLLVRQQESINELLLIRDRCRHLRENLGSGFRAASRLGRSAWQQSV